MQATLRHDRDVLDASYRNRDVLDASYRHRDVLDALKLQTRQRRPGCKLQTDVLGASYRHDRDVQDAGYRHRDVLDASYKHKDAVASPRPAAVNQRTDAELEAGIITSK